MAFNQRVKCLVPRKNQLCEARHLQSSTGHTTRFEGVDLLEECRQVDDDTIADHRDDVVVENSTRDQLQRILLVTDDDRVTGVVSALVPNDVVVGLGEKVDDLGFALITPLRTYDDCDGHQTLLRIVGNVRRV